MSAVPGPIELDAPPAGESPAFRAAREANAELTRTNATPAAAFRAARRMYLKGQRVDMLAYAVVRVTEGFIYNDAIIGGAAVVTVEPEVERAAQIVALLLD